MPARSERIYLSPREANQPGRVMRLPIWWDVSQFWKKYRHRAIEQGGESYVDYVFLLNYGEAMVFDEQCREQFSRDPRSKEPDVIADMQRFESVLSKTRWVI